MPRLPPRFLVRTRVENPLLAYLLPTCRDLQSARNELRWLREHISAQRLIRPVNHPRLANSHKRGNTKGSLLHGFPRSERDRRLEALCIARGRGKPLQYLIGTEFFGDLEIQCRPGVLIPRPETAEITTELVRRLTASTKVARAKQEPNGSEHVLPPHLRVLDLCTGTGCMSLLFHHEFAKATRNTVAVTSLGIDISPRAINLVRANVSRLTTDNSSGFKWHKDSKLEFARADVLSEGHSHDSGNVAGQPQVTGVSTLLELLGARGQRTHDILIANPPYISPQHISRTTARSVRNFEPRLALVPPPTESSPILNVKSEDEQDDERADLFYPRIFSLAAELGVKVVMVEVGDTAQALRVARMAALQQSRPAAVLAGISATDDATSGPEIRKIWDNVEVWRDGLGGWGVEVVSELVNVDGGQESRNRTDVNSNEDVVKVVVKGPKEKTSGRAVVCWRGEGGSWMVE